MSVQSDPNFVEAVMAAIKAEVQKIVEEESVKASKEVKRRCMEAADTLALKVLSHYEIRTREDRLVIEVRKKGGEA